MLLIGPDKWIVPYTLLQNMYSKVYEQMIKKKEREKERKSETGDRA